jgi:transposase-like protein
MPPRGQFGTEISGNVHRGLNLSPEERQRIIAKAEAAISIAELVDEFQRSPNCIRTTIRLAKTHTTTLEARRSGRPLILSLY